MPELPDLQAFARNLHKQLAGKTVKGVKVHVDKKLNVIPDELAAALTHHKVKDIYREGKELHMKFSNGKVLGLHLMLHGKLFLFEENNDNKFSIVELIFSDGTGLVLTDFQKAATPTLDPEEKPAPDALAKEAGYEYLKEKLGKTRSAIKTVLLDQKVIRGIGNAYADEILWDARISPFSASNKIPDEKIKDLAASIRSVLEHAGKQILKEHPDIINGEVRDFMLIHNSKKKQSPAGAEIMIKADSRKTYYTSEQELYD